jgi:hypothetical protein
MSSTGQKRYDAFLSYNSQDRSAIEELYRRFEREGLLPYLDSREVLGGRPPVREPVVHK